MGRRQVIDPRVRAEVIATYGNTCWLGLPGCTVVGEEDDHIVPHSHGAKRPWPTSAEPASTATPAARTACCTVTAHACT